MEQVTLLKTPDFGDATEHEQADFAGEAILGGVQVSVASKKNDDPHHRTNDDRAGIFSLAGLPYERSSRFADGAMEAAIEAVHARQKKDMEPIAPLEKARAATIDAYDTYEQALVAHAGGDDSATDELYQKYIEADRHQQDLQQTLHKESPEALKEAENARKSGAGILLGTWNSASGELTLRQKGDPQAYFVVHDDKQQVAIRISSPKDSVGPFVLNCLGGAAAFENRGQFPIHQVVAHSLTPDSEKLRFNRAEYNAAFPQQQYIEDIRTAKNSKYPNDKEIPTLDVNKFKNTICDGFGLAREHACATLVCCTDGLEGDFETKRPIHATIGDVSTGTPDHPFAEEVAALRQKKIPGIARELTLYAPGAGHDNSTAVVIPLEQMQGIDRLKSTPITFAVIDGMSKLGGRYAQEALDAVERFRAAELEKEPARADARRNQMSSGESQTVMEAITNPRKRSSWAELARKDAGIFAAPINKDSGIRFP